ncbi:RNA polymerase sigma factor [Glaciecola sp. MF2-115]|uniref:RNA polymerase sigma factor n=1 Tax=Glaciecola sp. MF2-115 TaxID=3384827 RepID=UPI00399EF01D
MEKIYNMYASSCFCLVNRIIANQTQAQDIVHVVFVKVLNNIQSFNFKGSFAGWLRQMTVNESISYIRQHAKYSADIELPEEFVSSNVSQFDSKWWENCHDLSNLTEQLTEEARAVLFLHEIEGYSHKEIAAFFDKSESFSKQSLARTLHYLQRINQEKEV